MAGIDHNIIGQLRPLRVESPVNALSQVMGLQNMQQQAALGQMQMEQAKEARRNELAMNEAYKGAYGADGQVDQNALMRALAQGGMGSKIPAIQKQFLDVKKTQGEIDEKSASTNKHNIEAGVKALGAHRDMLSMVQTPEQMAQWIDGIYANPQTAKIAQGMGAPEAMKARIPTDPAKFAEYLQMNAMGMDKFINEQTQRRGQDLSRQSSIDSTQASIENNKRSVGASYANANATRDAASINAKATREAAKSKYDQDTEMKMADDYRTQSKDFKDVIDAHKRVNAALGSAPKSAAATLAAATSFMKMLDPGSVVRESELGMALKATGAFDRATNYFNTLQRGQVLTESQAKDFKAIADKILEAAKVGQRTVDEHYRGKTKQYGLRPEMVVQDLGQGGVVIDFGSLK